MHEDRRQKGRTKMQLFWKQLQTWRGYLLGILDSANESVAARSYEPIKPKKIQELAACCN